jgi:hypothetical protein
MKTKAAALLLTGFFVLSGCSSSSGGGPSTTASQSVPAGGGVSVACSDSLDVAAAELVYASQDAIYNRGRFDDALLNDLLGEAYEVCDGYPNGDVTSEFLVLSARRADGVDDGVERGAVYYTVGNLCQQMGRNYTLTVVAERECARVMVAGEEALRGNGLSLP